MKKAVLISLIIFENAFSYMLIFVLVAIVSFLMQGGASMVRSHQELLKLVELSGIEHKVMIGQDLAYTFDGDPLAEQKLQKLSEMPEIESSVLVSYNAFFAQDRTRGINLILDHYREDIFGDMRYPLIEGEWPDKPYEVVLNEDMRSIYQVGQKIPVSIYYLSDTQQTEKYEAELTVTGFIPSDAQILTFRVNRGEDISEMATTYREEWGNSRSGAYGVVVEPPLTIRSTAEMFFLDSVFILPSRGVSAEEVKQLLIELFPERVIHVVDDMIEEYRIGHRAEYENMVQNLLIVSSLALSVLFSSVFLQLRKKNREMSVYYMCGITWSQGIGIFCVVYIPIILLSFFAGSAAFIAFNENRRWFDGKDSWLILLILLAVSFLFVLPLYVFARRSSPVEQTRKD